MILFKKSYAEQLIQLALTLSFLRVNPDNYLGWGWQSQLALHNGDGWLLELHAAATPSISDYPYSNRKAVLPLIEDLVRFDRYRYHTSPTHDIQTYLLNIQNEQKSNDHGSSNGNGAGSVAQSQSTAIIGQLNETATIQQDHRNYTDRDLLLATIGQQTNEFDLFLSAEHFIDSTSMLDQNLADLNDYADQATTIPYAGLPQKDEPPDIAGQFSSFGNLFFEEPSTSTTNNGDSYTAALNSSSGRSRNSTYSSVVDGDDLFDIKIEDIKDESEIESDSESGGNKTQHDDDGKSSTSGFSSTVELTEEESEIVEILWKQDVDLGYSLEPIKLPTVAESLFFKNANDSDDETEKLKALEEIKNEKNQNDLDDEWAGIQFTIDNETGEYIQHPLQLDELLQDVLQLASLTTDDSQSLPDKPESSATPPPVKEEDNNEDTKSTSAATDDLLSTAAAEAATTDDTTATINEIEISANLSHINLSVDDASELDELEMMIQSAGPFQHPSRSNQNYGHGANTFRQSYHHHHHQPRVPLSRAVSMEQRLQDIAHLFNPIPGMGVGMGVGDVSSYPHYPSHYSYQSAGPLPQHGQFSHPHSHSHAVLHNASLAELGASQPHYGPNLGTAVSSSMHITNSSHESDGASATGYKMDPEMMYYSNTSSELNHTTDGFINSILNDEDLQLMDMGVNEGFYTMRMLEPNSTSNNSSVLGIGASGGHNLPSNGLIGSSMQTSLSSLGPIGSTGDRLDASSDSAVSSMGSERVPSLSDGEWGDAGSDSAQDYHQRNYSKYGGPYDYSYNNRLGDTARHPVAQKKHHMFGKRYFQEQSNLPALPQASATQHTDIPVKYEYEPYAMHHHQHSHHHHHHPSSTSLPSQNSLDLGPGAVGSTVSGAMASPIINNKHLSSQSSEMKYSCSIDFTRQQQQHQQQPHRGSIHDIVSHNHTYTMPQSTGASPRPQTRDKKPRRHDDEHLSRDEKRARALNIPMPVQEIINLPMDEFNERLSKYDLSETQLSLIRDIRRRGKNKVAAQNCRKRKLDQIICLADEVNEVKKRRDRLCSDREAAIAAKKNIMYKFSMLHKHVFQNLRDPDGNPYPQNQYSLQQSADGSIYLLPKDNKDGNITTNHNQSHQQQGPSQHHPHNHHHHKD